MLSILRILINFTYAILLHAYNLNYIHINYRRQKGHEQFHKEKTIKERYKGKGVVESHYHVLKGHATMLSYRKHGDKRIHDSSFFYSS